MPKNVGFFSLTFAYSICDIQEKFRNAIWEFPKVCSLLTLIRDMGNRVATSQKLVKAAKILNIPVFVTTQNASRLGATVPELTSLIPETTPEAIDKTAFSMLVPALQTHLQSLTSSPSDKLSVLIVGIETHICVTQTTLDLLAAGHKVYVIADGVSSCNAGERPVALHRLAREGAIVTTSESLLFELLGDAKDDKFKAVSGLVKETKEETRQAVETFCRL
ncbi:Isochorismatase domain-containing protein 2, mitochondrial [Fonsecaea pedrosoi]|nr:Isochorismatase domain-containing protein 2, mitochondrial [Fonsecaea pedrosoi]